MIQLVSHSNEEMKGITQSTEPDHKFVSRGDQLKKLNQDSGIASPHEQP